MMIRHRVSMLFCCVLLFTAFSGDALHAACEFEFQGEGRVSSVLDMRTFRLDDGREVRLAGIEPPPPGATLSGTQALSALIAGREVTLRGPDDRPDRYGRQPAFVFVKGSAAPVQLGLLTDGEALASSTVTDTTCNRALLAAEAAAQQTGRGIWAGSSALKSTERLDDILAGTGQFVVVEGTVSSARLAGATFYVNFGRRWTRDFAVTISRRRMALFEAAGIDLKLLRNRRIRVRGWIERRGGPRMEATHPGQIELMAAADILSPGDVTAKSMRPKAEGE